MTLTGTLERRLREVSQRALFSDVEHCIEDIVALHAAEPVLASIRLQEVAGTLDYDVLADTKQCSALAA